MSREIKFRAFDKIMSTMHEIAGFVQFKEFVEIQYGISGFKRFNHPDVAIMQYTGFKDSKGIECYEGDIKREEIEEDDGDKTFYYVCVWVQEWAMFCWLCITDGEYQKYLDEGAESLDEVMFWTYAFNAEDIAKSSVCGNIYQNPELLNS